MIEPWQIRVLWKVYSTRREIARQTILNVAAKAACSEETVYKYFRLWDTGLMPEFAITKSVLSTMQEDTKQSLRVEARRREISVKVLVERLLKVTARDNLYDAIIGRPDRATKDRYQKRRSTVNAV